jgi:hypothetical protein
VLVANLISVPGLTAKSAAADAHSAHQPVTSIVDAIRNALTQQPVGTDIWTALARCVGILVVAYVSAMIALRDRILQVAV